MSTAYAPPVLGGHYGFRQAARMEWIKLRSLRSTAYALLLTVVGMISMGVVTMANTKAPQGASKVASFDPTNNVLAGVALGQLVIGVLGVLVVTGEYASGTIRSTLAAVPDRRLALAAKAAVFGGLALFVGELVTFVSFVAGSAALSADVPHPSLGDPDVLRAVLLSGAYLAMVGLMGIAIGVITRHTASAIGVLVGITYVLPALLAGTTGTAVARFFPTMIAGNSLAVTVPMDGMLSPWAGFVVLCLYTAAFLAAADRLLARRDA
ncbi:ABC transporter permease subunit [Streptomyces sp. SID8379]|uniref:ABC transporter permease n=1 Tax=unclassified Streptomyces TaxID=2593676 RepID=UPI00035F8C64|nr:MULTISPECIES: ABC transporter permease [unclassified Streptomyces]MYW69923.1 ABC transporter permease subunit [Streptomyces sp. SID8379]